MVGYFVTVFTMHAGRTQRVCRGHIKNIPCGYFIKVLINSTTTYSGGNLVGLWGVFCKSIYWVLVGVNYVYIIKDIKLYLLGLFKANWRVNYKSDLNGPGGFVLGTLFQNPQ